MWEKKALILALGSRRGSLAGVATHLIENTDEEPGEGQNRWLEVRLMVNEALLHVSKG